MWRSVTRQFLVTVTAVMVIVGSGSGLVGAVDRSHLIQPGVGIGVVHLGDDRKHMIQLWGSPTATVPLEDGLMMDCWCKVAQANGKWQAITPGVSAIVDQSGVVVGLGVTDPAYYLAERIHVGSTEADVRAALGDPDGQVDQPSGAFPTVVWSYRLGLDIYLQQQRLLGTRVAMIMVESSAQP
jgi:hypothetical protein